jgi:hypothetical protein
MAFSLTNSDGEAIFEAKKQNLQMVTHSNGQRQQPFFYFILIFRQFLPNKLDFRRPKL